jgi:hypothetical protein
MDPLRPSRCPMCRSTYMHLPRVRNQRASEQASASQPASQPATRMHLDAHAAAAATVSVRPNIHPPHTSPWSISCGCDVNISSLTRSCCVAQVVIGVGAVVSVGLKVWNSASSANSGLGALHAVTGPYTCHPLLHPVPQFLFLRPATRCTPWCQHCSPRRQHSGS